MHKYLRNPLNAIVFEKLIEAPVWTTGEADLKALSQPLTRLAGTTIFALPA
jgi:hypothetical protein